MDLNTKLLPDAKAIFMIEASGTGQIKLPQSAPTLLSNSNENESVIIPGRLEIQEGETLRVGRDMSNEVVLDIPNVSRFHAIITATSSSVRVADLSSTNGTYVNGNPVTAPVRLGSGDTLEIGSAKLKVELLSDLLTLTNMYAPGTQVDAMSTSALVTVLVADICDFTTLSETLPGEDVTKTLQIWFERTSEIIKQHGGQIDKYIGDCVMAFWRCSDHNARVLAIEAVKACLAIKKDTLELSESEHWAHRNSCDWNCRVSLNTGQVMIGQIGGRGARDYTVLGDVVNVAFRLNGVAGQRGYDMVLGDTTAGHISDDFDVLKLGPISVKGRKQDVIAYTLS